MAEQRAAAAVELAQQLVRSDSTGGLDPFSALRSPDITGLPLPGSPARATSAVQVQQEQPAPESPGPELGIDGLSSVAAEV
jgi:hypothetical protein